MGSVSELLSTGKGWWELGGDLSVGMGSDGVSSFLLLFSTLLLLLLPSLRFLVVVFLRGGRSASWSAQK